MLSVRRHFCALLVVLIWATVSLAIPFSEYRDHVKKAIDSLNLLTEKKEGQTDSQRAESRSANLGSARAALPRSEIVEWQGTSFTTDNSWFVDDLKAFEEATDSEVVRARLLAEIHERLRALQQRLEESDKAEQTPSLSEDELQGRLAAILQRSEYVTEVNKPSALERLMRSILDWINNLLPRNRQMSPGRARVISTTAQVVVAALALAVIVYVVWLAVPRLLRKREPRKKKKAEARVVLGEQLEPDQSGADLLAEAEALARAGDLRGAIRKGYIALLVELGDRKVISLAQYKTNRDYLRSVREIESLHGNMLKLTSSFEQHWYGLEPASETDWTAFRDFYRAALAAN
jgi:Domain of unknown function (DUF4129)